MKKPIRKHQLVGRMFVTIELKPTPASAAIQGCAHEVEVENTTTIVHDVIVHSKVLEGTLAGAGQNSDEIELRFNDLLDSPSRKTAMVGWSFSDPKTIRIHTLKISTKCDIDPTWADDLVDPVIEETGKK